MGGKQSKHEALFKAVRKSDHEAVKTLHGDGASLEWADKEGRTPLMLACTLAEWYDMTVTLLNEGARVDAFRAGPHGGYPLHHAANRGLDKTVLLLLDRGANPLATNDVGLTALDMARKSAQTSVVRIIEERICLFSGVVRELSGPGFWGVIVPQLVSKKVWVVVLPTEQSDSRKIPRNELVIYEHPGIPLPRTVISIARVEVEEPRFGSRDPILIIIAIEKNVKVKLKFMSENEGDRVQLERLYKACGQGLHGLIIKGIFREFVIDLLQSLIEYGVRATWHSLHLFLRGRAIAGQSGPAALPAPSHVTIEEIPDEPASAPSTSTNAFNSASQASPAPSRSSAAQLKPSSSASEISGDDVAIPDDIALALAINASIATASAEGVPVSPSFNARKSETGDFGGWVAAEQSIFSGWGPGPSGAAKLSRVGPSVADTPSTSGSSTFDASAPPLPVDGPIHYHSMDLPAAQASSSTASSSSEIEPSKQKAGEITGGQCVVCWDAPAQAVCIPCGHISGCMDCLTEIKSKGWGCPVCRAPIQQVVKVYSV